MKFLLITLLAAQAELPSAPTAEFLAGFTTALPSTAFATKDWAFKQITVTVTLQKPDPGKPLDAHAVRTGICTAQGPCAFKMDVLLYQQDIRVSAKEVLRYVLRTDAGKRVEGYGQWDRAESTYGYFHRDGDSWVPVIKHREAEDEHLFVQATWDYMYTQVRWKFAAAR